MTAICSMLAKNYQEEGPMDSKEHCASKTYRRRLLRIAAGLVFAIAVLAIIQRTMAFRGDFLWILMVAMGFVLGGVLLLMLPGRPSFAGNNREPIAPLPWEEPSWYDSSHPGSPFHRED